MLIVIMRLIGFTELLSLWGINMDFIQHQSGCDKCKLVDKDKPATLVHCCLIGAPLLRDYLSELVKPDVARQNRQLKRQFTQQADGKSYKTNGKKLKEVMRYK